MNLRNISESELRAELESRQRPAVTKPEPLASPGFSDLVKMIVEGTAMSLEQGYEREDFQNYVYEAAMTAVYGKSYWQWRRAQKWG